MPDLPKKTHVRESGELGSIPVRSTDASNYWITKEWLEKKFDEVNRNIAITTSRVADVDHRCGLILQRIAHLESQATKHFFILNHKLDSLLHPQAANVAVTFDPPVQK